MPIGDKYPSENDRLILREDLPDVEQKQSPVWCILVVDDDEGVHDATRFALRDATLLGRRVELVHAYSAAEGLATAQVTPGIAVALIDVVMETHDAGLRLVRDLRACGLNEMRIVLRTGHPGYAPELSIVNEYEIDDYRTKDELTRTRLVTVLTASVRAYEQIRSISRSQAGLRMIVQSTSTLFARPSLELFSQGVLTQIASFLGVDPHGFVCASVRRPGGLADERIVSAAGRFAGLLGKQRDEIEDPEALGLLEKIGGRVGPPIRDGVLGLSFRSDPGHELTVVLDAHVQPDGPYLDLIRLFSANIAIGFENLSLIETLDRLAYLDPIIETPNLNAFETELARLLGADVRKGRIALTDIDSFRALLAAHGPRATHELLRAIYANLRRSLGDTNSVARIGDGTFGLLGAGPDLDEKAVQEAFARPFEVDGVKISATATTAILDLKDTTGDPLAVTRCALAALLHVKQTRPGRSVVFDDAMREVVERRATLRRALEGVAESFDGLAVHLQPKFDLKSGEPTSAEALLRWTLDGQLVSPADFIPVAEAAGLTERLTYFVVDTIGAWAAQRRDRDPVPVAINLSMADLNTEGFAGRLLDRVKAAGLEPSTVRFEVTEGVAMQNGSTAIDQLAMLQSDGFGIALDDFGTGYSSLSQIERLPIDTIKIDRSFVSRLTVGSARHSLAAIVVAVAGAMGTRCVAEGIETEEQKQALRFLGCDVAQGFLLGRPTPIAEFEEKFLAPKGE